MVKHLSDPFNVRLRPEDAERLDTWRARTGMSRSAAVRALVALGLDAADDELKARGGGRLATPEGAGSL